MGVVVLKAIIISRQDNTEKKMLASLLPNNSFESQLLKDIVCSFLKDNIEMRKCLNLSHPDC